MLRALKSGEHKEGRRLLDLLYGRWANGEEAEVEQATGAKLKVRGTRGQMPRLAWKSVLRRDTKLKDTELASFLWLLLEVSMLHCLLIKPCADSGWEACLRRLQHPPSSMRVNAGAAIPLIETAAMTCKGWSGSGAVPGSPLGRLGSPARHAEEGGRQVSCCQSPAQSISLEELAPGGERES